jgi:O-antigen/teichoic acid export membrane protein
MVSLFFPWWFGNLTTGLPLVYFAFYSFLASSVAGYIFNYKQLLVGANQKQYLTQAYFQTIGIVQSLVQILLAYYYRNLWLWVAVGLFFTLVGIMVFNIRIRQLYPWLNINLPNGRKNLKQYPEILKKTRQIFILRIKDFILNRSDELLVGAFVSVTKVAFYGNYSIIISKLVFLVNILENGLSAGVGNLLAENNESNTMKVFWEMTATRFFIMGMVIFPLVLFIQPLIACWVGPEYQLSSLIAYLLIFNLFLKLQYSTVYIFIGASGLYGDVWASWAELIINLAVTLTLAPFFGIVGILLGKIISLSIFNVFWKPYYLFSEGFHKSVWQFWRSMMVYYGIFGLFTILAIILKALVVNNNVSSWPSLIIYALLLLLPILAFYFLSLFTCTRGMKYFVARKPSIYNTICKFTFQS